MNEKNIVRLATAPAFALWLAAIVGATIWITIYSDTPGREGNVPRNWPEQSRIALAGGCPTLLVFAHPKCPCTKASIGELDRLMARLQGRIAAHVLFLKPATVAEGWAETDLWREASAIPGVAVQLDAGGEEARRFNCLTSGDTLLYNANGRLLFHGGITLSRGHSGDNPGRSAILALLEEGTAKGTRTPVFGCPLFDAECTTKKPL